MAKFTHLLNDHERLKNVAQAAALAAAGVFFLVKLIMGFLVVDMTTTLSSVRFHDLNSQCDQLVLNVSLQRGSNASVDLHRIRARLESIDDSGETIIKQFEGVTKVAPGHSQLWKDNYHDPYIRLPPGEGTHFSTLVTVDPSAAYVIEVSVQGKRPYSPFVAQWKATSVSVPLSWVDTFGDPPSNQMQETQ